MWGVLVADLILKEKDVNDTERKQFLKEAQNNLYTKQNNQSQSEETSQQSDSEVSE